MSFENSIGPWICNYLYVMTTDDDYSNAFDALKAAFSYASFILLIIWKGNFSVAILASELLESLSVKVHLSLTWLLSKKYEGP